MTNRPFASLCVLAWKRPQRLEECLNTLIATADRPYELIVNLDGDDTECQVILDVDYFSCGKISKLIMNNGKNRGVGKSFDNCLSVAEGEYIVKIDTDLTFKPNWLSTMIGILDNNPDIGTVSPFDYNHYDPNDDRFKPEKCHKEKRSDCIEVEDFVSSIYAFRHDDLELSQNITDDGVHQLFGRMAITKQDYIENHGFGVTKSTYVSGTEDHPFKTPTYNEPLIFKSELSK